MSPSFSPPQSPTSSEGGGRPRQTAAEAGKREQASRADALQQRVDHLHTKLDLTLAHLHLEVPAPPAVGQAVMERDGPSTVAKS